MNKVKKLAAASLLFAVPVIAFMGIAHAQSFKKVVEKGEIVNSTIYATGSNVDIKGTVNGDVYCAGSDIEIDGVVNGDVICAGQTVNISGTVTGSIRVAGMNVTISNASARSASIVAQVLTLDSDTKIAQDATLFGQSMALKGTIGRDLTAAGQKLTINNSIGRDVKASVTNLAVNDGAKVGGTVNYTSKNAADVDSSAQVIGGLNQTMPQEKSSSKHGLWGFSLVAYLFILASMALISLVTILIMPKAVEAAAGVAQKRWGMSILVGFLSGIAIPFVLVLLAMTVIGLPLVFVLLLVWGLLAAASGPIVAFMIGRMVLRKKAKNAIAVTMLGTLILVTAYFIPFIGVVLFFVACWLGIGAVVLAFKAFLPTPKYSLK